MYLAKYRHQDSLNKGLVEASKLGDLSRVQHLIQEGADPTDWANECVMNAAFHGHLDVLKYLIEMGAGVENDIEWCFYIGGKVADEKYIQRSRRYASDAMMWNNALTLADRGKNLPIVEYLLTLDIKWDRDSTFYHSALNFNPEIFKAIIYNLKPNVLELQQIIYSGVGKKKDFEFMKIITEYNPDFFRQPGLNNELVLNLCCLPNRDINFMEYLFETVEFTNQDITYAFSDICRRRSLELVEFLWNKAEITIEARHFTQSLCCPKSGILEFLLQKNGELIIDKDAVKNMVWYYDFGMVCFLIENGFDVKSHNNKAIRLACEYGPIELVNLLLNHGADLHVKNGICVQNACRPEIIKLLIEHGLDMKAFDNSAIEKVACILMNRSDEENECLIFVESIKLLLKQGAMKPKILRYISCTPHLDLVREVVSKMDFDENETEYRSALENACIWNHLNVAEFLLSCGTYKQLEESIEEIFFHNKKGHDVVVLLVKYGIDPTLCAECAIRSGNLEILKTAISLGAEISSNLFVEACRCGSNEMVEYLMEKDIDYNAVSHEAFHAALKANNYELVARLRDQELGCKSDIDFARKKSYLRMVKILELMDLD